MIDLDEFPSGKVGKCGGLARRLSDGPRSPHLFSLKNDVRLAPVPFPLLLRPLTWRQRARHGKLLEPTALWAHRPRALIAFVRMFRALRLSSSPIPARLRSLVSLRVSELNGCAFCIDLNASLLRDADANARAGEPTTGGTGPDTLTAREQLALEYAEAMTATPPAVDDELFERMRGEFTPEAIVELTGIVAFQNMSARFNAALDAAPHGFCEFPAE